MAFFNSCIVQHCIIQLVVNKRVASYSNWFYVSEVGMIQYMILTSKFYSKSVEFFGNCRRLAQRTQFVIVQDQANLI